MKIYEQKVEMLKKMTQGGENRTLDKTINGALN